MSHRQHQYLAVEGAIGVGKTTLARLLRDPLDAGVLLEVFEENPFLGSFYADPERYAFQTQIFFLLSRYRQQNRVIRQTLRHHTLVSDYMFDKDRLFARLNLQGDELEMYERVQAILSEQIPEPDLVVFLRADTDVLMQRISFRDRPYERGMSRDYIERLRLAYERFFAGYKAAPVLLIDTNNLDFVSDPQAKERVIGQVRETLSQGMLQQPLPDMDDATLRAAADLPPRRRVSDLQRWQRRLEITAGPADADVYMTYLRLTEEVGKLGAELRSVWGGQEALSSRVGNRQEARDRALEEHVSQLQRELADCLTCLLSLANETSVDLELAYVDRLDSHESSPT
jgi:deoxyguanosine kinase